MHVTVDIKPGLELTKEEVEALDAAHLREWKLPPLNHDHLATHIFALVKKNSQIVAQGQFNILDNVQFAGETFSLWEVGGIISNDKGKEY